MDRLRRGVPVIVSAVLVLATGVLGFVVAASASSRSEALHSQDRSNLQTTLSALGRQYVLFSLKEGADYASSGTWVLRPGDPADTARLRDFVDHAALLNYGAALVRLDGTPLSSYTAGPGLPGPFEPGYAPMMAALMHSHQPGVSSLMTVGRIPVAAMGVPILVSGRPRAIFVGFVRLDHSALETYVEGMHYGRTGVSYVVDSSGIILAAADPSEIGRPINQPKALAALEQGRFGDYQAAGSIVSYAPFGVGGWSGVTTQSSSEFFGPIRSGHQQVEVALFALLAIASLLITAFIYKQESARRRFHEELAHQAYHDSLTGLGNRSLFLEQLGHALARSRRNGGAVAVLYLDLNGFKAVNDHRGHEAGDAVLVAVAGRLRDGVRSQDTVARMGGDEFAIVMEDLGSPPDLQAVRRTAERVMAGVAHPINVGGYLLTVGASIGIAVSNRGEDDVETILRDADLAMYQAKDGNSGGYVVSGRALDATARQGVRT